VPDFVVDSCVGLLAPVRKSETIVRHLFTELNAMLNDPVVRKRLRVFGIEASASSMVKKSSLVWCGMNRWSSLPASGLIEV
jgi:hypothetical protein